VSARSRMSSAVPNPCALAWWIIRRDASRMTRREPAMKITDAIEHAKPSQTVVTSAVSAERAL